MELSREDTIRRFAAEFGFELCGFANAEELEKESVHLGAWLERGYHAGMAYMERNQDKRKNPALVHEGVRSVISLGMIYNTPDQHEHREGEGKISRYAWGDDYHDIMWERLEKMCAAIRGIYPEFTFRYYVDTGPVMDKVWAVRAGLGWMGKHTNIISREKGSWFFIANIFTNLVLAPDTPLEDFCGSCTACIDACPTGAIVQPWKVDAGKCISYLTIENKGEISSEFNGKFDGWIFGCDVCQDVCPWNNKFGALSSEKGFLPRHGETSLSLQYISNLDNGKFRDRFSGSPVLRTKLKGLKRNADFLSRKDTNEGGRT